MKADLLGPLWLTPGHLCLPPFQSASEPRLEQHQSAAAGIFGLESHLLTLLGTLARMTRARP